MKNKNFFNVVWRGFGFFYFLFHAVILAVFCIMSIYTQLKNSEFFSGWVLAVFPVIGIFAGQWIRHGKYGWWRILIIIVSLLVFLFGIFASIFVLPQIKAINKMHQQKAKELRELDAQVTKYFNAVYVNDLDGVVKALDEGVYINATNKTGNTALHVTQNEAIARILIERGADVNARDDMHMTPIFNKEVPLQKILVEAGADIHAKSEKGNTPLMWYCYSGYLQGIKHMISSGADINVKNNDGQTAYDIAQRFHPQELLGYLKSVGAKPGKEIQ